MTPKCLWAALAVTLAGCATTSADVAGGRDIASTVSDAFRSHVRTVKAQVRADRDAARATLARLGLPGGKVASARPAPIATRDLGLPGDSEPSAAEEGSALLAARGHPARDASMPWVQMEVGSSEMVTLEGALHPRAARALANMESMAREHGGEFTVSVPRSQIRTAAAIREVAPGATILSTDESENYRLIVVAGDR